MRRPDDSGRHRAPPPGRSRSPPGPGLGAARHHRQQPDAGQQHRRRPSASTYALFGGEPQLPVPVTPAGTSQPCCQPSTIERRQRPPSAIASQPSLAFSRSTTHLVGGAGSPGAAAAGRCPLPHLDRRSAAAPATVPSPLPPGDQRQSGRLRRRCSPRRRRVPAGGGRQPAGRRPRHRARPPPRAVPAGRDGWPPARSCGSARPRSRSGRCRRATAPAGAGRPAAPCPSGRTATSPTPTVSGSGRLTYGSWESAPGLGDQHGDVVGAHRSVEDERATLVENAAA